MKSDTYPQQMPPECVLVLCRELQAVSGIDQLADVLQVGVQGLPGVGAVEVDLEAPPGAKGKTMPIDVEDPAAKRLGWIRFPLETSRGVFGSLHLEVLDQAAFADYYYLLSTTVGLAALQAENIRLSSAVTLREDAPISWGVADSEIHDDGRLSKTGVPATRHRPGDGQAVAETTAMSTARTVNPDHYELIARHTSDSIWAMDANLQFTYLSPSTERLFGYSVDEWQNLEWGRFVHAEDLAAVSQIFNGFAASSRQISQSAVIRVYHKNGRMMWVEFTASPIYSEAGEMKAVVGVTRDITDRRQVEIALEKRVLALTKPLDDSIGVTFEDLFNIDEIQQLQDEFAAATGIASLITRPDGTPITRPSQFTRFCNEIVRKNEKGCANCHKSDAILGAPNPDGPIIQPCLSGGLWDAGASINLDGRHIASWLVGQVRDETQKEEAILDYADEIGVDREELLAAFREVPSMSRLQFEQVAQALFTLASQLSTMAFQNVQQARFITDRKEAEAELRASEQAHRSLVEAMPDVVMRFDREGRHLFVSDNVSEMVSFSAEDFQGKTHREIGFDEEQCELWERHLKQVWESGFPLETEFEFEGKQGTIIMNWRIVPEKDELGVVHSLLSLSRDVTAQRQAERDYQILFQEMYEGFSLFRVIADETGQPVSFRFLAVNPAFERMIGITSSQAVGKSIEDLIGDSFDYGWEILTRVALSGKPERYESEAPILGKFFEVTVFKPAVGQIACILMDVTGRKRAEADRLQMERRIQHAQKLESLGVLAGGIAHDFNNILFAIMGNASMALEMVAVDHPARSMLEEISVSGDRASALVRQILTFARRTERQRSTLDIVPLLKEVTKLMRATLPSNVVINQELGTQRTMIVADASELHQILMNLCTNAGYAMRDEGGSLVIRLKESGRTNPLLAESARAAEGQYYLIEVQDTGPGIAPEIQEKMFDPFFTTKPVGEGTGMGLALVQSITTELGGWLEVVSEVGQGSTFRIYLPKAKEKATVKAHTRHRELPGGSEHVMVVDDEQMIASLLNRYLRKLGYEVSMFTSSLEAAEEFAAHPDRYDLAILDQTMPDLTGRDLSRRIQEIRPGFPIIIATGYSSTFSPQQAVELGVKCYLDKPVDLGDLAYKVREVMDEPGEPAAQS